jgi:hypothetical protein
MPLTRTHQVPTSPHTAILHGVPKTEPRTLGFGFLPQTRPPASRWRSRSPPTTSMSLTRAHHPPSSPQTAISHGTPETESRTLSFGFLAQPPPPGLALANAQHPCCHHAVDMPPPPPSITPHCCSTRHAQNRVTNAQFRVFGPNPTPRPHGGERAAPLLPPCSQHAPTSSQHHPTPPFYTACPKPSNERSVLGISPKSPPPPRNLRMHHPTTTTALYASPHHLPPSPPGTIPDGAPKIVSQPLGFGLSAKISPQFHFFSPPITFSCSILALYCLVQLI